MPKTLMLLAQLSERGISIGTAATCDNISC